MNSRTVPNAVSLLSIMLKAFYLGASAAPLRGTSVAALRLRRTGFLIGYLGTFRSIGLAVKLLLGLGCTLLGLSLPGLVQQMIPTWVSWLGALLLQPLYTASFALINSPIHLGEY